MWWTFLAYISFVWDKLPLIPVLMGTMPVVIIIISTVLAGSFPSMKAEYFWAEPLASVSLLLASGVLLYVMIVVASHVEVTLVTREEELKHLPFDEEVKRLEEETSEAENAFKEVTRWEKVPFNVRSVLILSLFCIIIPCYVLQLFKDEAFKNSTLQLTRFQMISMEIG